MKDNMILDFMERDNAEVIIDETVDKIYDLFKEKVGI